MKKRVTEQDYVKACRKGSREAEIELHGRPVHVRKIHRSKKAYDRKKMKAGLKRLPYFFAVCQSQVTSSGRLSI